MFGGVMEDMHFPEAEKNFTGQQLAIDGRHASPLYGWVLLNASEFRVTDDPVRRGGERRT
jgi:hypothetical protein